MSGDESGLPTIALWANVLADWLDEDDLAEVRHGFLRISDDLRSIDGSTALTLCNERPQATGSDGVDAALASLVEFTLGRAGVDPPAWTDSVGAATEPFYIVVNAALRDLVVSETPETFARRNVWVPAEYFESV